MKAGRRSEPGFVGLWDYQEPCFISFVVVSSNFTCSTLQE